MYNNNIYIHVSTLYAFITYKFNKDKYFFHNDMHYFFSFFLFFFAIFKVNRSSGLRSQGQFQQCHSFPMTTNFSFH